MTATIMSPSRAERWRGPLRWISAAALFALMPKCVFCLAAYAGLGALLGVRLGGPEICGGAGGSPVASVVGFALLGLIAGVIVLRRRHRVR